MRAMRTGPMPTLSTTTFAAVERVSGCSSCGKYASATACEASSQSRESEAAGADMTPLKCVPRRLPSSGCDWRRIDRALRIGFAFVGSTSPTCAATFAHHAHRRREASMVEQRELRSVFGNFASGVTVITCRNADGDPHGATVTAFTWVSMEPRLCQVTVTRKSKACKYLSAAPFAVNVLAADQVDTAMHFAGRPCIAEPGWADGPTAPILRGASATISCVPWAEYDGGDHVIFIGEI